MNKGNPSTDGSPVKSLNLSKVNWIHCDSFCWKEKHGHEIVLPIANLFSSSVFPMAFAAWHICLKSSSNLRIQRIILPKRERESEVNSSQWTDNISAQSRLLHTNHIWSSFRLWMFSSISVVCFDKTWLFLAKQFYWFGIASSQVK